MDLSDKKPENDTERSFGDNLAFKNGNGEGSVSSKIEYSGSDDLPHISVNSHKISVIDDFV